MTTTLPQAVKILEMLKDVPFETVQQALETGFFADVLKTGEIATIYKRMAAEEFERNCALVEKTVAPEDLIVTRPQDVDSYHGSNPKSNGKYQMRFWKKQMGFIKSGGHVSDSEGCLLFEYYSSKPQGKISYPNEVMDLSRLYNRAGQGGEYEWRKETVEKKDGYGRMCLIDVFTLRKVS